ncbi:MAG: FadR family transcriptional regulator [Hyphomicrobiales bacterium]|nr:MAG: FadR family transcriptional regulator [Hyphomicrobiales bacterium]
MSNSPTANPSREDASPPRLSTTIYDAVLSMITRGEFAPNSRLPSEAKLSAMYGASRPVVREALARLKEDGIVVSRQGSGSYVRRQPDPSILDLAPIGTLGDLQRCFEFRANTEPSAAGLAALRWQQDDMDNIDAAMSVLQRCIADGFIGAEEDATLHEAIADATHNNYHRMVQRMLRPHVLAGMNVSRSLTLRRPEASLRMVQDEHVVVVEAIRRRDAEAAAESMRAHILNARHRMFEGVNT